MKILVAIPHHMNKNYCFKRAVKRANDLTYKNTDVVIRVDQSEFGSQDEVKSQREFFRKLVLDNDHDYLYFMGVDTIPPKNVLEELLYHNQHIVGGVYFG